MRASQVVFFSPLSRTGLLQTVVEPRPGASDSLTLLQWLDCRVFRFGAGYKRPLLLLCSLGETTLPQPRNGTSEDTTQLTYPNTEAHIYKHEVIVHTCHASVRQQVMSTLAPWTRLPGEKAGGIACFVATNSWSVYRDDWPTTVNRAPELPLCPGKAFHVADA